MASSGHGGVGSNTLRVIRTIFSFRPSSSLFESPVLQAEGLVGLEIGERPVLNASSSEYLASATLTAYSFSTR